MASVNAVDVTRDMLAYTLNNDKQSLIKLLSRNGIQIPADASDKDVAMAVLLASSKSSVFKSELVTLLSAKIEDVNREFQSFVGGQFDIGTQEDKTMFTGSEDFFNATGKKKEPVTYQSQFTAIGKAMEKKQKQSQPKEKGKVWAWLGENVFTKDNINAGINIGLTTLNNKIQSKRNQVEFEASEITDRQDQQIREKAKGGVSTQTIVIAVVGIALVGAMVYYFTKK